MDLVPAPRCAVSFENCIQGTLDFATPLAVHYPDAYAPDLSVRLARNTFQAGALCTLMLPNEFPELRDGQPPLRIEAVETIYWGAFVLHLADKPRNLSAAEFKDLLRKRLRWSDTRNIYRLDQRFLSCGLNAAEDLNGPKSLEEWEAFWGLKASGSKQVTQLRFAGIDPVLPLHRGQDQIRPENYRLHTYSPGRSARPDGQDLGADVDLVGPGPAYERWKKTPEYQQWLKSLAEK